MLLHLLTARQLKSGGYGLDRGAHPSLITGGNSCPGLCRLGWEAMVKCCGVAVAMPQGYSRVPGPPTGQQ
jgi:hypothetical protein